VGDVEQRTAHAPDVVGERPVLDTPYTLGSLAFSVASAGAGHVCWLIHDAHQELAGISDYNLQLLRGVNPSLANQLMKGRGSNDYSMAFLAVVLGFLSAALFLTAMAAVVRWLGELIEWGWRRIRHRARSAIN
jgi:hypothetical protein